MAEYVTPQDLQNAHTDAKTLEQAVNGAPDTIVTARLGASYPTLSTVKRIVDTLQTEKTTAINNLNAAINTAAAAGAGANGWTATLVKDASGKTQQQINDAVIMKGDYGTTLGSPIRLKFIPEKASLLYGLNDPTHLDDAKLNVFRGLNNQDAWHESNIPIGAVAFGRNNVPFAYLSAALGHDCVAYGVASITMGAGSCTGNPDVPSDGANYGYCSIAIGKNTQARGRISYAFGEECLSATRYSGTSGYQSQTGKTDSSHPNYNLYGVDGEEGAAAQAHGFVSKAYGNFAFAYGSMLAAYNGSQVIGKGINEGSPLVISRRGLGLGYNVAKPTIFLKEGNGIAADGAWVGFNTDTPINRYDFRFGKSDTLSFNIDTDSVDDNTSAALVIKGKLGSGEFAELFKIHTTHPNSGQAYGQTQFWQNSNQFLMIDEGGTAVFSNGLKVGAAGLSVNGVKVIGGQLPAIANATADLQSLANTVNSILAALRAHGLIAT